MSPKQEHGRLFAQKLKKALRCFETSNTIHQSTWCNIAEDLNLLAKIIKKIYRPLQASCDFIHCCRCLLTTLVLDLFVFPCKISRLPDVSFVRQMKWWAPYHTYKYKHIIFETQFGVRCAVWVEVDPKRWGLLQTENFIICCTRPGMIDVTYILYTDERV
jgi:ribosomal protein S26